MKFARTYPIQLHSNLGNSSGLVVNFYTISNAPLFATTTHRLARHYRKLYIPLIDIHLPVTS
jgi:hypothetical protein